MDLEKVKALLSQALEKETAQDRADFLKEVGAHDPEMKAELESLLKAHDAAGDFLSAPAPELGGTLENIPLSEGPGTVIGPYKLLEKIGEGGMAAVYMAQQTYPLKRRVALKIIKLGMDTREVIARFEGERQALAMMDHPNIARVFDAGATDTGRPYFVMELVRGTSLTAYCDRNKLSTQDRLALFLPVCHAVHHAHQKGIIHRDLKPSNIMVTLHDGRPIPKVIDFGISKATDQQLTEKTIFTRYAQMIGTPEYMSPEQAEMSGLDIDTRTDIYSLGIVLYELLTGVMPFDGETLRSAGYAEIQRIIREEEPQRPSTRISALGKAAEEIAALRRTNVAGLTRRLNRELEWIPMKALRKDRARRYASASEFAQDIHNYLNDQPLMAGPESTVYRLKKMMHKHRVPIITICSVGAFLIAGLAVTTWLYVGRSQAMDAISELTNQTHLDTARRLYAEGRYQEALDEIHAKFDERDMEPQVHLLRAQLLMELGRFHETEAKLLELTRADPEIASSAHYLLASAYMTVDPEKAEQHTQLAESLLPDTPKAYYLRAMCAATAHEAVMMLNKALVRDCQYYEAYKARALAYSSMKAYQDMAPDVSVLIALRPQDYVGYALRAIARRETGQLEKAVTDYTDAIRLCLIEDERPQLLDQRRKTYMLNGDYNQALADAQHYAVLRPNDAYSDLQIFTALVALREYEKAKTTYRAISKRDARGTGLLQGTIEANVLDFLSTGQPFQLPPDIAAQSPFYLMDQATDLYALLQTKARPLAAGSGFWLGGDWSSDGKQIVHKEYSPFSWLPGTIDGTKSELQTSIETMDVASGKIQQISRFGDNPLWSPDRQYIAFTHYHGDYNRNRDVWFVPATGGQARKLAAGVALKWSQDSRYLYYQSSSNKSICSMAVDVPDTQPVTVLESSGAAFGRCAISPDEGLIAIQSPFDVRVLTFPEGQPVVHWELPWPLTLWVTQLQWHPNKKTLILNSRYFDNDMGMCLFDVGRAEPMHVFNLTRPWCRTLWSPDGSKLMIQPFGTDPWIMDIDPTRPLEEVLAPAMTTADFLTMLRHRWDQRIAADPLNTEPYVCRAAVVIAAKDFEQARQDLTQCVALIKDPNDPACYRLWDWVARYGSQASAASEIWRIYYGQIVDRFPDRFKAIQ